MFGADKQLVSLDWDTGALRVAQWRLKRGRPTVVRMATAELPHDLPIDRPEEFGAFIRRVLEHEGIRSHHAVVDVPRSQVSLNTLKLPAIDVGEMAGMVRLQVAKELPFPLTEAVIDFAVAANTDADGSATVMVAAVRRDVLRYYQEVCHAAELTLQRLGLRPFSNMVAVMEMLGTGGLGRVLYADVGPQQTEIGILRDGALVFSRSGSVTVAEEHDDLPGVKLVEVASSEDRLVSKLAVEVNRSAIDYRRTDPGARFDAVVVSGSSGHEYQLAERLGRQFEVEARVYDPTALTGEFEGACAWAAVVGLGLGHATENRLQLDFVHPKRTVDAAAKRRQKLPWLGAALIMLGIGGAAAYAYVYRPQQEQLKQIKEDIRLLEKQLATRSKGTEVTAAIDKWQDLHPVWPDELMAIMSHLPKEREQAFLRDLRFNSDQGQVSFDVLGVSRQVIADLEKNLSTATVEVAGKPQPLFKVTLGAIIANTDRDSLYPWKSTVTVQSTRILELKDKDRR